jgi:hypothetical protein
MPDMTHPALIRARNEFYSKIRHNDYTQTEIVALFEKIFEINREGFNNSYVTIGDGKPRSIMEGSKY